MSIDTHNTPILKEPHCVMQANLFPHPGVIRTLIRRPSRLALTFAALDNQRSNYLRPVTPVGYLPCDEGTGNVAHDVVGHHDATLFGASGWKAGLVGPFALSFPGFPVGFPPGSYAEIPSGDVLDTTQSYTVAAWVKLKDYLGKSFDYSLPPYSITVLRLSVGDDRKGHDYDESAGHQSQNQD